jgi:hypothetical protein
MVVDTNKDWSGYSVNNIGQLGVSGAILFKNFSIAYNAGTDSLDFTYTGP